jgi:hypothetical protein
MFKIARSHAISRSVYFFLSLALLLPYFAWTDSGGLVMTFLQNFSVFLALMSWFCCLLCATRAVANGRARALKQTENLVGIFILSTLLTILLLQFNFGIVDFLNLNQEPYLKQVAPVVQLHFHPAAH